jgi:DnaJ-class molecular chaperone
MLITIGPKTREHMDTLNIKNYPFTESELKANFRQLIKTYHEDVSTNKNAKSKSQWCINAYNELKNIAISDDEQINKNNPLANSDNGLERDLFDFSEPCVECNGQGSVKTTTMIPCGRCDLKNLYYDYDYSWTNSFFGQRRYNNNRKTYSGYKTLPCYACKTTGKFILKSGREVECDRCHGTGKFKVKCKFCNGTGYRKKTVNIKCRTCNGIGRTELNVYNPVIPKGAILG